MTQYPANIQHASDLTPFRDWLSEVTGDRLEMLVAVQKDGDDYTNESAELNREIQETLQTEGRELERGFDYGEAAERWECRRVFKVHADESVTYLP